MFSSTPDDDKSRVVELQEQLRQKQDLVNKLLASRQDVHGPLASRQDVHGPLASRQDVHGPHDLVGKLVTNDFMFYSF